METERILVVDDDPAILALCHRILQVDGYTVVEAKRGEEALAKLEADQFDLLLTDVRLPGLNGLEITQRLRERGLELTVVTMTGYSNMEMAIQALSLGVDEFLIKPFTLEGLRITIARALEKSRLRREITRLRTLVPLLHTARALVSARTREQCSLHVFGAAHELFKTREFGWLEVSEDSQMLTATNAEGARLGSLRGHTWFATQWQECISPGEIRPLLEGGIQCWNEKEAQRLPFAVEDVEWLVCVPLRAHDRTLALLLVGVSNPPSKSDLEALSIIAAQASATLENVELLGQISRAYVNAKELDRLKGEFINIAGHELRTPLAVLNGYARILRERTDGELREYARQVVTQADRLQHIADDMLDLRFLEQGRAELRLESCLIQEVVEQVVTAYRPLALEREQTIETDLPAHAGVVTADRAMLDLMLGSLISNAIKFSPRSGRVRVAAQGDQNQVTFQVQDQGKGLTLEQSAHVFDAFYQAGNSLTRAEGGIGLGLTLTREMVRAHGGIIWVESQSNGGSSFFITLPRVTVSV